MNDPQPPPKPSEHPAAWDLVLQDIRERDHLGEERYGTRLRPFDGRDTLVDKYQEQLDELVYTRKLLYERNHVRNALEFFRSAIKSKEPWTERCEEVYVQALAALGMR